MKRGWSGCERRRRTPGRHRIPHRQALRFQKRVCPCGDPAFHRPARPRPFRADAPPSQILCQACRFAIGAGRHRSNPAPEGAYCSGEVPQRALQVRKRPAGGAAMARTCLRNIRSEQRRACSARACHRWLETTGARGSGSGLNRASGLRRPVRGDCRVHSGSANRSSGVMRASTALRTSRPALCSMALQSVVLWMVATIPRSKS